MLFLIEIIGAGKSSLLNVLAGRSTSNSKIHVEGKVKVGGHIINPVSYRKNIAYVMQDDFILATATPREALTFSASLRLPASWTDEAIKAKVEKLITDLGIEDCCDTLIGGELIKGISGGQRKRTSVGIELITDPTVSPTNETLFSFVDIHELTVSLNSCYSSTSLPQAWTRTRLST